MTKDYSKPDLFYECVECGEEIPECEIMFCAVCQLPICNDCEAEDEDGQNVCPECGDRSK